MNISDRAQEILEDYWIRNREERSPWRMEIISGDPIPDELVMLGYAKVDGRYLDLSEKGWEEASSCIRRQRLAERLLADVLDIDRNEVRELGCKFEHALQKDVEENICTLLGHPQTCPHDKPLPEGSCCIANKRNPRRFILPLSECDVKNKAKVAYIRTRDEQVMNKLISMGILPGLDIQLLRKTPSFLFQMGESQFAIDKSLAEKIQVRLSDMNAGEGPQQLSLAGEAPAPEKRMGIGWRLGIRLRRRR